MVQLVMIVLPDSHHVPPPLCSRLASPVLRVAPLVKVNPERQAPLVRYTQRPALSPLVVPATRYPLIVVTSGPLILWTVSPLVTAPRLVNEPYTIRPPV